MEILIMTIKLYFKLIGITQCDSEECKVVLSHKLIKHGSVISSNKHDEILISVNHNYLIIAKSILLLFLSINNSDQYKNY